MQKKINRKILLYFRRKKIIPGQLMEQPTWRHPIVVTWIIFVNLTSVLGILFHSVMLE